MTKYYGLIVTSIGDKTIAPTDITVDHKPQIEYAGIGCFCKWHTSIKARDEYATEMINLGFGLDIEGYDKYYGKID